MASRSQATRTIKRVYLIFGAYKLRGHLDLMVAMLACRNAATQSDNAIKNIDQKA
jgi:hypothetical protein